MTLVYPTPIERFKQPGEAKLFDFSFAPAMSEGETISSIQTLTWTSMGLVSGSGSISLGAPVIGTQAVNVLISGGTSKEGYKLRILVVTSYGQILEIDGRLRVKEIA